MNKRKRNIRIGPIGEAVLGIFAAGAVVTTFAMFPGLVYVVAPFIKKKKYSPRQAIERNLASFIKTGLVKRVNNAHGGFTLQLTKRGAWEVMLRHRTIPSMNKKEKVWDKIWRVVIFDVPNKKNKERSNLRQAMLMYGFKPIQKSAWVYPYECDDFIVLLKSHLGIAHDVLYMKVSYIENDRHLQKEFNL